MAVARLLEKAKGKPVVVGLKNKKATGTLEEADANLNVVLSDADLTDAEGNTAHYAMMALRGSAIEYMAFSG